MNLTVNEPDDEDAAAAINQLIETILSEAVADATKALQKAGISARVVAKRTPDAYLFKVQSHKLSDSEHKRAEEIVSATLLNVMRSYSNSERRLH